MKSFFKVNKPMLFITLIAAVFIMAGCDGGGGSSSGGSSTDTGSVGLFLTDGPSDDYDHFWIWLKTIKIYPENGTQPVTMFQAEDPNGQKIDLLDLRDRELLLGMKSQVRSVKHNRLVMELGDIKPEGYGICASQNMIVNKNIEYPIDFNVPRNATATIHIDIDIEKSLHSLNDGDGRYCEFWPVLFVHFDKIEAIADCPQVVTGIVGDLLYDEDGMKIKGFSLEVKEPWFHQYENEAKNEKYGNHYPGGAIDVWVSSETTIYDVDGTIIGVDDIEGKRGDEVIVRGVLDEYGYLQASYVVFGKVTVFKGTVTTSDTTGYTLTTASGSINVSLGDESIILTRCNELWPKDTPIPLYYFARVYGKFIGNNNEFLGIVTRIRPQKLIGDLVKIEKKGEDGDDNEGYYLTVEIDNDPVIAFLPESEIDQVFLKRDWPLRIDQLVLFIACKPRTVEIAINPEITDQLTAARVTVQPEVISGTVKEVDVDERLIFTEEGDTIFIFEGAMIIKQSYCRSGDEEDDNDRQNEIELVDINVGDKIKAYGLRRCPVDDPDSVFDSYTLVVRSEPDVEPEPDTIVIKRNKVTFHLQAEEYDKNLIIKGNKVRLIGKAGDGCKDDEGWTIINGRAEIKGNKAELQNIKFRENVYINGNKAKFHNVVFEGDVIDAGNKTEFTGPCSDFVPGDDLR